MMTLQLFAGRLMSPLSKCNVFNKFDHDEDAFEARFNEVTETLDFASFGETQDQRSDWKEFVDRMDGEIYFLGSTREQLAALYQQIQALLQQYEAVVQSLEQEQKQRLASKRLEEETAQQLTELEKRVKEEVREGGRRLCAMVAVIEQRHGREVAELQAALERLRQHQEDSCCFNSREDVYHLKSRVQEMTLESDELRRSLLRAQGNICVLQTEVEKLSGECTNEHSESDAGPESDGGKRQLQCVAKECQSYSSRIQALQELNKKLHDRNDGLHSALNQSGVSENWRAIPNNERHLWKLKPLRQSTLNYSSFVNEDKSLAAESGNLGCSRAANCGESYLDNSLSLTTDAGMVDSSSSEYDSDDSHDCVEMAPRSCISDIEALDRRSEGAVSMASSMCSSISSNRRRLSAFCQEPDADGSEIERVGGPVPVYRLVLAGDAGSGKSSFLLRLSLNDFRTNIQTTLGVDFQIKTMLVDGERTDLQIWDTAGQERFRSISRSYFRKAQGVLLLYDVTSVRSFFNVRDWMSQIQECTEEGIPMCVIGNKADLRAGLPEGSCVSTYHGERLAMMYNALFCETSAKDGSNIVEAVLHLAREVKRNVGLRRRPEQQTSVSLVEERKAASSCCRV
ncbi:hypothetical protein AAFF_G00223690 [Aldrovandia affinis]|uniref:Uncharacterized protein n=1 Tax=Aldrovandia affinis TaxID=143900 RepID=A0AAD7TAS7_9TELE|nr:hypothetical protein AAFF_G00223690 [Aldrovandia affinis]